MHKVVDKIGKVLSLARTSSGRAKLREVIKYKIFNISLPLIGICGGWNFWKPAVGIEPTNRCNLNCVMCARRYWDKEFNRLGDMSMELFKDKILPFLRPAQRVTLQCFGEPLLAKHFFEMLSECKKKRCNVNFTTNGTLLKKYARKLVELETDSITISLDGIGSFRDIRGVEIHSVIAGIQELNSIKRELKVKHPAIQIEFVAMQQNVRELPTLVDLAYRLEIKHIIVVHVVIHSKQLINQSLFLHTDTANKYFNEALIRAQELGIQIHLPPLRKTVKFCRQPFELIFINWNGDVRPCCAATINEENTLRLGNLEDSSLEDMWNSSWIRELRRALLGRKQLPEFCKRCAFRVYSLQSHIRILKNG